jgi:hypothetical protein
MFLSFVQHADVLLCGIAMSNQRATGGPLDHRRTLTWFPADARRPARRG